MEYLRHGLTKLRLMRIPLVNDGQKVLDRVLSVATGAHECEPESGKYKRKAILNDKDTAMCETHERWWLAFG